MTTTYTGSHGTAGVYLSPANDGIPNARASIRAEVNAAGEIELIPLDALAAYFLKHFGHSGSVSPCWHSGANRPGFDFKKLVLRHDPRPLLSTGGDPYHTGMVLTPDEVKECRALVEQLREAKRTKKPAKKRKGGGK